MSCLAEPKCHILIKHNYKYTKINLLDFKQLWVCTISIPDENYFSLSIIFTIVYIYKCSVYSFLSHLLDLTQFWVSTITIPDKNYTFYLSISFIILYIYTDSVYCFDFRMFGSQSVTASTVPLRKHQQVKGTFIFE